jgi:hypothetical protein
VHKIAADNEASTSFASLAVDAHYVVLVLLQPVVDVTAALNDEIDWWSVVILKGVPRDYNGARESVSNDHRAGYRNEISGIGRAEESRGNGDQRLWALAYLFRGTW